MYAYEVILPSDLSLLQDKFTDAVVEITSKLLNEKEIEILIEEVTNKL